MKEKREGVEIVLVEVVQKDTMGQMALARSDVLVSKMPTGSVYYFRMFSSLNV